jgi:flagellar hook-length control protein FliK
LEKTEAKPQLKSPLSARQDTAKISRNEPVPNKQDMVVSIQKDSGRSVSDMSISAADKDVPKSAVTAPHAVSPEPNDHGKVTSPLAPEKLVPEMTLRTNERVNPQQKESAAGGDKQQSAKQEPSDNMSSEHEPSTPGGEATANKAPSKVAAGSISDAPVTAAPSTPGNQSSVPMAATTHPQPVHGATDAVQVSQFASLPPEISRSVVAQIAQELQVRTQENFSEIKIMLKPESLGEVFLKVKMEDGKMTAQIDVNQANVKVALESNLPQLREILVSHGIDIDHIDIMTNGQSLPRESGKDHADKSKHHGKRRATDDTIERYEGTRSMGYNTVEYIM